jgi:hypothetical protein
MSGGGKGSGSSTIRVSRAGEGKRKEAVGSKVSRPKTIIGGAKAAGRKKW